MKRDIDVLNKLQDYFAANQVIPSFSEIAKLMGISSTSTVASIIQRLKEQGFLNALDSGRLKPGAKFFERMLVSQVRAGRPETADELQPDALQIDNYLVSMPSRTTLLEVKGDSMQDAGLMQGDVVIVERGSPTKPGDIIVAVVDGEFTLKYLMLDDQGEFYLKAANSKYDDIHPTQSLEVYGLVVGQFRRYRNSKPASAHINRC